MPGTLPAIHQAARRVPGHRRRRQVRRSSEATSPSDKRCQEFARAAPELPRLCVLINRRHSWEGTTVSYIDVAIPAIAGIFALAWPQMFLRKPPDERKVRRVRQFGLLFLAIAAVYLAMRLAGV